MQTRPSNRMLTCLLLYTYRLEKVLHDYMKDFAERMKEIKGVLEDQASQQPATLQDKEALLDELMEIVENVDYARGGCELAKLCLMLRAHPTCLLLHTNCSCDCRKHKALTLVVAGYICSYELELKWLAESDVDSKWSFIQ